jgi:hypothetical protein
MPDYWMAFQIVQEAFRENLGQQNRTVEERLKFIAENMPVQYKTLENAWGISRGMVSQWAKQRIVEGLLVWCDESGREFDDKATLNKQKRSGKAYLKIADDYSASSNIGLPTPYELTGDSRWNVDGEFLQQYDLRLDSRQPVGSRPRPKLAAAKEIDSESSKPTEVSDPKSDDEIVEDAPELVGYVERELTAGPQKPFRFEDYPFD